MRIVAVLGTGTEVGKTWVTAAVIPLLAGRVAARKPAQSFEPGDTLDSEVLGAAAGEPSAVVCPPHRHYEVPMAPVMAAAALGRPPFTIADLVGELSWPAGADIGFVEGAGGVLSPLATDGDNRDYVRAVGPDVVVLVADAGLGTINSVRLCVAALEGFDTIVFLNRYDETADLHRRNAAWLREQDALTVATTIPALADLLSRSHPRVGDV